MSRNRTILLVEDNADDAVLTVRAFERSQIANEVVVASDGEKALDYLFGLGMHADRDPSSLPEVVLLDLKLPRLQGMDVLRQLRAHPLTKHLPVVILTSSDEEKDIAASYNLGANSFVRKPVDFAEFVETAKQVERYWLILNQPPTPGSVPHP